MRRVLIKHTIICLLSVAWPLAARADIAVIVHPDNPVQSMTPREVSNLYLGRARSFSADSHGTPLPASVYEQPADSGVREIFFRTLNGMDIKQLNAYWARLRFSGEVLPPAILPDSRAVVETVSRKRSAIGYVDAAAVNSAVKVVLRLKE
ncbi:MAG: hypothetical protein WC091_10110 [Sulfuricellaceae bacterium]